MAKKQGKGEMIELARMIAVVRDELAKAEKDGEGKDIRFKVEEVELELALTIEHDEKVAAGFKVLVFEVGGEDSKKVGYAHKVTLKLRPQRLGASGKIGELEISGEGVTPADGSDELPMGG